MPTPAAAAPEAVPAAPETTTSHRRPLRQHNSLEQAIDSKNSSGGTKQARNGASDVVSTLFVVSLISALNH
jgi:hypothetical protein